MKKEWKSNNYNNVRQIVEAHTHMSAEEFLHPQKDPYLVGLKEAVQFVKLMLTAKVPIHIVGDYDVDGEMSSAILKLCLEAFGGYPVHVRLPKRFSEGYGLSMKIIDEISDGLIITVDNGIAALEQVKTAKAKGLSVVVIDHHLPVRDPDTEEIILPEADYVIDPKAVEGSMFSEYCGAGLAYRFAKELLTEGHPIMNNLLVFASIATITDMVPLIGDNRTIVKDGLEHINHRDVTFGLQILLDRLKLNHVTEEDYGFLIGPVMNASGRMLDDGPIDVVNMVTSLADPANPEFIRKTMYLQDLADELVERNEKRKKTVEKDLIEAESIIREKTLMNNNPLIVYSPNFWEGTIGILAGKLAEKYQVPCLVFTKSSAKGIAKGSGRTYGNIHLKYLLDKASDLLVGYGGHAAAAGMSIKITNISILQHRLKSYLKTAAEVKNTKPASFYDMEISENDIPSLMQEVEAYAPYGIGNPKPVFRMDSFACSPVAGKFYKDLGENQICTKFTGRNLTAIGFHLADAYKEAGEPKIMNIIGSLSKKKFQFTTTVQMEILDFENAEDNSKSDFYMDLEKTLSFI